jgi:hypothetical protein
MLLGAWAETQPGRLTLPSSRHSHRRQPCADGVRRHGRPRARRGGQPLRGRHRGRPSGTVAALEWEFAARGGTEIRGYKYSGSNTPDDVAWHNGNSGNTTHPVRTKAPNELGLYDMSGNVWEWCSDWYGSYSAGAQNNPTGPTSGSNRVYRGGSWLNYARSCRSSCRSYFTPTSHDISLGLRLAL